MSETDPAQQQDLPSVEEYEKYLQWVNQQMISVARKIYTHLLWTCVVVHVLKALSSYRNRISQEIGKGSSIATLQPQPHVHTR